MAIITMTVWFALYMGIKRFFVREQWKHVLIASLAVAIVVEFFCTQDFYWTLWAKIFSGPAS